MTKSMTYLGIQGSCSCFGLKGRRRCHLSVDCSRRHSERRRCDLIGDYKVAPTGLKPVFPDCYRKGAPNGADGSQVGLDMSSLAVRFFLHLSKQPSPCSTPLGLVLRLGRLHHVARRATRFASLRRTSVCPAAPRSRPAVRHARHSAALRGCAVSGWRATTGTRAIWREVVPSQSPLQCTA
jgi:hypothetical protein